MDTLLQDLRYAIRQLLKARLVSGLAIATLGIGIGAVTAIFSTVHAALLRPLPYPQQDELIDVHTRLTDGRLTTGRLSTLEIAALANIHELVAATAAYMGSPFDATLMRPDGTAINAKIDGVGDGFFELLGLPMTLGRAFTHEEHLPVKGPAPNSVILSHRAWREAFASDPSIVGRHVRIAEAPEGITVVGVANAALDLPRGTDFWFNARMPPNDNGHNFDMLLRLRPGATIPQLESAGAAAMASLARTESSDVARAYVFRPLLAAIVGDLRPTLLLVLGATALLLVLACVNVANLLLARSASRMREIALRSALGASRGRVIRQLLTESLVLAAAGAALGLALAYSAVRLLLSIGASQMPRLEAVPFDATGPAVHDGRVARHRRSHRSGAGVAARARGHPIAAERRRARREQRKGHVPADVRDGGGPDRGDHRAGRRRRVAVEEFRTAASHRSRVRAGRPAGRRSPRPPPFPHTRCDDVMDGGASGSRESGRG